ncbi:MAG: hypothetical protein LBQ36_03300 [Synergistaceae bacterium]|nr:hypothetical protein [Synergistaceae bacterium]
MNKISAHDRSSRLSHRAFSLAELMISAIIASVLMMGLAALLCLPLRVMQNSEDVNAAQTRAEMVFAIVRAPLDLCGYGMPIGPESFKSAFGATSAPFNWKGAISVERMGALGGRENAICKIAYAVGTTVRTTGTVVTSADEVDVIATGIPPLLSPNGKNSLKSWVLFGSMLPRCYPMMLRRIPERLADGRSLLPLRWNKPASSDETIHIPENDAIFYMKAMECRVILRDGEYTFYTNDHSGSGWQPRVAGVIDVRFELGDGGRILRVTTLTRGKTRYDRIVTKGTPPGWPEEYADDIPPESRHYRLFVNKASFGLKNF